jgi:AcrR family transcriptional regulator
MLDETTSRGRIIAAALRLAGTRPWAEITMRDIADAAGANLAEMRREFASKSAILLAFTRAIDDAVLTAAPRFAADQPPRDRLFEVVMSRLDALRPYKAALKSIATAPVCDPAFLKGMCASQAWMLHAAGIGTDGLMGTARVAGLATLYGSVLRTWLEDDDPAQARTMAALDRNLKRGEQALGIAGDLCRAACRMADIVKSRARRDGSLGAGPESPPPSVERLEHVGALGGGDAGPVVVHLDAEPAAFGRRANDDLIGIADRVRDQIRHRALESLALQRQHKVLAALSQLELDRRAVDLRLLVDLL